MTARPSFYERRILPRLLDLAMRNKEAARFRARLVPRARGLTLEIGIGSGLNLPFYSNGLERLVGIDPSEALLAMARKRACEAAFPVELARRSGESLPFPDSSVDTVVFTFALCTIPDPGKALREARRVLKPSGELLFAEHGLAPDEAVRRWQRRLNPLWRRLAGGCHLDRRIDRLIAGSGFRVAEVETAYAKGPRPMSYVYLGRGLPG